MNRNLSPRTSIEEARLEIVDSIHDILLHQRHPVPPPRTTSRQFPRPEGVGEEDQQSSRQK